MSIPWIISGFGEDIMVEPATLNPRDSTYIPNDNQPIPFKRIKVIERDEKAAVLEDSNRNI